MRMFCFDYDNTVFSHTQHRIPPRTLEAMHALKGSENIVVMSTGRDLYDPATLAYARQINADAIVHCNGLKITIGDDIFYEHYFDRELMERALEYADKTGAVLGCVTPKALYFTNDEALRRPDYEYGLGREFRPFRELYGMKVNVMHYLGPEEKIRAVANACPGICYYMFAGASGADVLDVDASKADGIERLLAHYGMTWEDVVAFGDSTNDIEMLRRAGVGIAMGNASDEVKAVADQVTGDIEQDGVADAIETYLRA
ncbi:MAG: HAD family phosphatase [Lachnospiraceae bacterium]|nr:HAD family phosphatase [Lachnospiraceae bacterium]